MNIFTDNIQYVGKVCFFKILIKWIFGFYIDWEHAKLRALNVGKKILFKDGEVHEIIDVSGPGKYKIRCIQMRKVK